MAKTIKELADEYLVENQFDSQSERDAFIQDVHEMLNQAFHEGIRARDSQLAARFPMQCAFLKVSKVEYPKSKYNLTDRKNGDSI